MAAIGVLVPFFGSDLPFWHRFLYEFLMAQKSRLPKQVGRLAELATPGPRAVPGSQHSRHLHTLTRVPG